jgi:uncharacterized membrane protein
MSSGRRSGTSTRIFWGVVLGAIALGVLFRVEHAQRRMFWADESWTALRVSGYTYRQLRGLFDDRVHTASEILSFQKVNPSHPVSATIAGLATEEPQHPPLFYAIDRIAAGVIGSSIPDLRIPAVVFSLLAVFAVAWLCYELSRSLPVAGSGAALMALSPLFVNYGGQAREYSLWALMIAVISVLLLRALRRPTLPAWIWYGLATALALYSDLLMLIVIAAQVVYVFAFYRSYRSMIARYCAATAVALLSFVPWMFVALHGRGTILTEELWTRIEFPLLQFVEKWAFNTGTVLFDGEYATMRLLPVAAAALLLLAYAAYRLFRDERPMVAWFVALPALAIVVPQILYDFATHGHESTESRYLIPLWFALLVAAALFLGRRLASSPRAISGAWLGALVAVLAAAAGSDVINSATPVWWDNDDNYPSTSMADAINASPSPLVVSEGHWAEVLVMSHYVTAGTRFLLFKFPPPARMRLARNSFLLAPSPATVSAFRSRPGYRLVPVPIAPLLSNALLNFRRSMLRGSSRAADVASFGGFLYRIYTTRRTALGTCALRISRVKLFRPADEVQHAP